MHNLYYTKHQTIIGKLPYGVNGPIEGKVGKVIGSSRNGTYYLKGPHKKRTKKISVKEKGNRSKFATGQNWLSPITKFVRVGFKGYSQKAPGFRGAISHILLNAVEGKAPNCTVNPELAKVSFGDLPLSPDITAVMTSPKKITFTWSTEEVSGTSSYDQVMLLVYDVEERYAQMMLTGPFRMAGSAILNINDAYTGPFLVYLAFVSDDRSRQSNSIYLGEFTPEQ